MQGQAGPEPGVQPIADTCWPAYQGDGAQSYRRGTFERDEIAARADEEIDKIGQPFGVTQEDASDSRVASEDEDMLGDPGRSR